MKKVHTLPEAARILRVSEWWLRGQCKNGAPHVRMAEKFLFTDEHLEAILLSFEVERVVHAPPAPRRKKSSAPLADVVDLTPKVPYRLRKQA